MTTEQLKYFLVTAKHLNFSSAAKELYVTQPAISHQIAMLEKELGTRLFTRTTRKIQLTKSGQLFLEDAKQILDMEETSKERILLADSSETLSLHISYLLAPCQSFLPKVLAQYKKNYPQVSLELNRMDAKNISISMDKVQSDIYFSMSRDLKDHPGYAYKDIFTDTFCLICSAEHPAAKLTKIDFNKLASERFIMFNPENASFMNKLINQFCHSINFIPKMAVYRNSMEEILFEVDSGLGVTILPMKNKDLSPTSVAYIPLSGDFTQIVLGIAWRFDSGNPAINWFLELLDQAKILHPEWF